MSAVTSARRLCALTALLAIAFVASVALGAVRLSLPELFAALRGTGDPTVAAIIHQLRLPRAAVATLVGGALAASGATFQALLRNPLAEPYILGVSGGAAVGAVTAIVLNLGSRYTAAIPAAAMAGALVAIVIVLRIAASVGRALDTRVLLLAGVMTGAFFNACILLILTLSDAESFRSAIFWMMGSFAGSTWRSAGIFALYFVPAILVLVAISRSLNLISVGEETAVVLGVPVERVKLTAYAVASLLAAAAVAVAGVIGFVGLIVPHVIRLLWGGDHRFLLPASILLGGAFLALADTIARVVAAPIELPVGVITAFIGVPFFVWLLRRRAA